MVGTRVSGPVDPRFEGSLFGLDDTTAADNDKRHEPISGISSMNTKAPRCKPSEPRVEQKAKAPAKVLRGALLRGPSPACAKKERVSSPRSSKLVKAAQPAAAAAVLLLPPPPEATPSANEAPIMRGLSRSEWMNIAKIKMVDYWDDDSVAVSYRFVPPPMKDECYFWIFWDNENGRMGKDQVGWQVPELNRFLLKGQLSFIQQGYENDAWTTIYHGVLA